MTQAKKNILMLIPNLDFGGAQRVFYNMSEELKNEYTIIDCVFNKYDGVSYPTSNTLIDLNIPGSLTYFSKAYYFILRCIKVRRIKKKYNIDICISHLEGADYVNILSKRKEKTILWVHGSKLYDGEIKGGLGWLRKKILLPFLYNKADQIVCVSRDIKEELIRFCNLNPQKINVITNAFDIDKIKKLSSIEIEDEYKEVFSGKVIIASGRLVIQKNQKALLNVFYLLKDKTAYRLVILGDGILRNQLIQEGRNLDLKIYSAWEQEPVTANYDVYFMGYKQNPFKYIARSSLFVTSSAWEGFPMALGEAMACGVPVLSTDCPTGPKEILAPNLSYDYETEEPIFAEYGILVPLLTDNSAMLKMCADTIDQVLSNKELLERYSNASAKRILDFGFQETILKWKQLINQ